MNDPATARPARKVIEEIMERAKGTEYCDSMLYGIPVPDLIKACKTREEVIRVIDEIAFACKQSGKLEGQSQVTQGLLKRIQGR